jgi:hypothetical protein
MVMAKLLKENQKETMSTSRSQEALTSKAKLNSTGTTYLSEADFDVNFRPGAGGNNAKSNGGYQSIPSPQSPPANYGRP